LEAVLSTDFEAIKAAAKTGWIDGWHPDIAKQFGLPATKTCAFKYSEGGWLARFHSAGPLAHISIEQGRTKPEAVARLILAARDYLKREERAKVVGA
jgi:hypothetical protein